MSNQHGWSLSTAISVVLVFLLAGPLAVSGGKSWPGSQQRDSASPSMVEKGKEIYGQACTQCHSPRHTMIQRKNADGWRKTIYRMISRGAHVMPGEVELLTGYLTATYGPDSPPAALGEKTGSSVPLALPEGRGREILVGSCVQCHSVQAILDSGKSQTDWKETVGRMRSLGANVGDSEEQVLVDYLSRHFAPR